MNFLYLLCIYFLLLGVGMVLRKMGNSVTPTVELKKDGDVYTFTTSSTFKTSTITFKLGEEFDEETLDGRKVKSICTMEGNKLVQEQKGDKPSTIVREFTDSELITVSYLNNYLLIGITINNSNNFYCRPLPLVMLNQSVFTRPSKFLLFF